ncbi:MAG TPA: polysaccharide deacetylase family protein [Limnochordia bacterium]|nr:polysaccharide deacetylase family protein [Limnochordia bacterium]
MIGLFLSIRIRWSWLAVVLVLAVAGVWRFSTLPRHPIEHPIDTPVTSGVRDFPIFYYKTTEKKMALTFDISWGEKEPMRVLDVLKSANQKATFFLSSPWSQKHPDVVKALVDAGMEIESHGNAHINLDQATVQQITDNVDSAHQVLVQLSGQTPTFLRPPNGAYDDAVVDTLKALNYETVIWSIDSLDWKNPGVGYMVQRVSREAFPGAIILFHASDSAKQTADALPQVLATLKSQGYQLVTLRELAKLGPPMRDDPRGRPQKPNQASTS